ncbi:TPA: hypothetical protein DDX46_03720 [Candidatus Saccharibacteria bacterium]|nr:MAG: hypothetical protein UW38_C0001G0565 [Candidatus Saccharibacteria bacterium GW2011_GWC2_44_17]MBH1956831.1 hypothetical protein [Candidatus Saccharibacteria bacterium]OGL33806.1 MAG: hypothetical protein A3E20_03595 [Candidatus Saccharibacteria bacterium RIFCSPHIGHO2_12_FULL_47_16]MBH1973381.1 hypothetical protein [Candidatus Saccharibacteria bacterium]MBH1990378.1 hypothetical protein [Candidatus Saccharibacteria bacterium]
MSTKPFCIYVPVDKIVVTNGPSLAQLYLFDSYQYENGGNATLTFLTPASDKTFTRKVRIWNFVRQDWSEIYSRPEVGVADGESSFSFAYCGEDLHCSYNYKTRRGEVIISHENPEDNPDGN